MFDWLLWFTRMENSKVFALVLFFATFCGIVLYVFTGKQRTMRLESYKYIPLQDESSEHDPYSRQVNDNERNDDQATEA